MNSIQEFLKAIDEPSMKTSDRALAVLWFTGRENSDGMKSGEICRIIEQAGHPGQNVSRLTKTLGKNRRQISRVPRSSAWRLRPSAKKELDKLYNDTLNIKPKPKETNSVLPYQLFDGSRRYIEKVVFQINASFDMSLYDCCAVMCRRLLETLVVEVYEAAGRAHDIKDKDGSFHSFSNLLRILIADKAFNLSRNGQKGLNDFKKLGDLSAHNRRYNATQTDIERIRNGIRIAGEELLHLAKLI